MAKWEEYCKQFGENLCHARAKAELTQERLATSVSEHLQKPVGRHAISDYEMGKRKRPPSDKMIDALMSALNITDRGVLVPYDESDRVQPFQIEATSYIETGNQNPEVIPYLGDYQCLFHSTDSASNYADASICGNQRVFRIMRGVESRRYVLHGYGHCKWQAKKMFHEDFGYRRAISGLVGR